MCTHKNFFKNYQNAQVKNITVVRKLETVSQFINNIEKHTTKKHNQRNLPIIFFLLSEHENG
ncbi:hypothetical protein GCM10023262_06090 [Bartonella pachyuromydis]|uniref:Uncharacterized protein n=1 Tax=Bartonella pachyuromydis TaxID=931097 RepID=A0ABP8VGW1_9HYPH